uniref:Endoplasmic reticulum lectin 1 n=2 Tax=Timema TaxID=61471 RepID=A0A7R9AQX9_TIMSH|nr:unnamed protein product [Timema shepardi]CAD7573578.1 unnamed protein product [Timema californicum]
MIFNHLCVLYLTFYVTTSIDIKNFDDTVLFKINWPGRNGNELLDTLDAETLVVSSENNEKYKCLLPHFQEKEKDTIDTYSGPSPLQLLQPLFTQLSCSYRLESYWTYEVCHGRYVRQYHEEREGKKVKLQEYYLGRLDNTQFGKLGKELEYLDNRAVEDMPVKKIDGLNMPYLQLNMSDGTECDLNGKKRMTKALYVCYLHGKHEVYSIKETSTCEYEVVVLSPLLCQHPKYKPQESGENVINCHPLERAAKKPRSLLAMEAESLKLKHQKVTVSENLLTIFNLITICFLDENAAAAPKPPPSIKDTSPVSSFLSGKSCLTGGSGWWKYEFCYGLSVDQYHLEKDGSKTTINLGRFDRNNHIEWLVKNPHKRPKPSALRKQISHFYAGGGLCEETGHPRQTEVKLKCLDNSSSPGSVSLYLLEPKTCEYILGVESPVICNLLPHVDENGLVELNPGSEDEYITVSLEDEPAGDDLDNTIANGDD